MVQKKILIPTTNAESWKTFIAASKHWRDGYSAKIAAETWEKANGSLPITISSAFNKNEKFKDSEMLLAVPEFIVPLPSQGYPSQNDLLVISSNEKGLTVITVEAKVNEPFGTNTIQEWSKEASDGKVKRLKYILKTINLKNDNIDNLRYQLFHRLASAIIMAKKFHSNKAMMIIQSFQPDETKNHFIDYKNFISAYNIEAVKEQIQHITSVNGIDVYALWVCSK